MKQKILLVDDREDNLFSIETILETDGYEFVKANSGRQALKILLKEYDFALILMDVQMPNLNGFETAALIYEREKLKHIPIIFITANTFGEENIFMGYRSGAVDYISKPINPELLRAKVSVFVDLYKKSHKLMIQEQKLVAINKNLENEIRERKANEEKIKELNHQLLDNIARLESANKDLDRFAFMASHDLQEPIRKIRMFTDRLYSRYKKEWDEEGKMYIDRIQKSGERMQNLIKDILTFSKISSEEKVFIKTDLNNILEEVLAELDSNIREKNGKVNIEKLPVIHANPGLIRPLFYNLISNSIKYSRKELEPLISISSDIKTSRVRTPSEEERKYCRIIIQDNGIGFDQKYAEQIFGMFKRLHTEPEYEGTGIGLALCKKIVEEHNGFISAQSKINIGSTFIISLPVDPVVAINGASRKPAGVL